MEALSTDGTQSMSTVRDNNESQCNITEEQDKKSRPTVQAMAGILMCSFLIGFYTSIETSIYVPIANKFNALDKAEWFLTGSQITTATLQPIYGRISDITGRASAMFTGIGFLFIGSLMSALSTSMTMVIIGRVLQGAGTAGIMALINIIIADLFPERMRAYFLGYFSALWAMGSAVSPTIGAVIVQESTWRLAFWINIPVCLFLGITMYIIHLPQAATREIKEKLKTVDYIGALLCISGVTLILLALSWGGREYPWSSVQVIICLVLGVAVAAAFLVYEALIPVNPIVSIRLLRSRNPILVIVGHVFFGAAAYGPFGFISQWGLVVHNASPIVAGLYLLPLSIAELIMAAVSGVIVSKTGRPREALWIGSIIILVGDSLLILLNEHSPISHVIVFSAVVGIGFGTCIQNLILSGQICVSKEKSAMIISVCLFMRTLGSILIVAIMSSISGNTRKREFSDLIQRYPDSTEDILSISSNQSLVHSLKLPGELKAEIITVFMHSMRAAFISLIPFASVLIILVFSLKHVPLGSNNKDVS